MFLGGAGLADIILYCRHKSIRSACPMGPPLPHLLLGLISIVGFKRGAAPGESGADQGLGDQERPRCRAVSPSSMVTTLERLLLKPLDERRGPSAGAMQLLVIERSLFSILRRSWSRGSRPARPDRFRGVHLERGDEIRIEGHRSNVILDGEMFEANAGRPIVLRPTAPVPFLRLAA